MFKLSCFMCPESCLHLLFIKLVHVQTVHCQHAMSCSHHWSMDTSVTLFNNCSNIALISQSNDICGTKHCHRSA